MNITSEQYRELSAKNGKVRDEKPLKIPDNIPEDARIKTALRIMGDYFDIPPKSVEFFIRQMELSKKL